MIDACDRCLRRAHLIACLAPRIAGLLDRPSRRPRGLLALSDERLITAVAGERDGDVHRALASFEPAAAREELADAATLAVCLHAAAYPPGLACLVDPPAVLFGKGDATQLGRLSEGPVATIVGTRRASPYGLDMAYSLARGLGAARVPVVSGLALGVDAAAHRGCLDGGGLGIAVLAGGPDLPYPRRNRGLYERLCRGGLVLSELVPGSRAFRWSFPARNRLMAGLGTVTVVIEAAERSGSLITAEFARDLGRGVAAVPGRATARMAAGSNALLRDGAAVVTSAGDLLDELYGVSARPDSRPPPPVAPEPADAFLRAVLDAVEAGEEIDGIASAAGVPVARARAALGRLEADGYLVRTALGSYERRAA